MKDGELARALEELAGKLGVEVRHERIVKNPVRQPKGGLCRVDGKPRIIIHSKLTDTEKVQVLIDSLRHFDLDEVYVAPELRQAIEGVAALLH